MDAIILSGVHKNLSHGNGKETVTTEVLRGVGLSIAAGERVGIIGPSGCGKTTLLRLINRLLDPEDGTVEVLGKPTTDWDPLNLRRRAALVLQRPALFDGSIADNILFPFDAAKLERPDDNEITRLLSLVELGDVEINHPAAGLSVGQQQRLCLARALALKPDILMLDETTSALDPLVAGKVLDALYRLCADGMALLHVTHEPAKLRPLDRVILLADGRVAEEAEPRDFLSNPRSEAGRVYVGGIL
ncbi:MAG: amino acid ABC transporter ATP-binding protein [bacterium]|nr:amino acid ABC transporter ATP-binding protein [bacterium]